MTNLSQLIGIPPAPTESDLLSDLVSAEVSVSSATSLTSDAFGKMHVVSGSSDYTVTLPAASGNSGKIIGLRITGTALFTIDGNGSEEIDGELTRVMWAGESAILLCDGSGWIKIAGKSMPFSSKAWKNATQTVSSETNTVISYQVKEENFDIFDLATNKMIIPRKSSYQIGNHLYTSISGSVRAGIYYDINGTEGSLFPVVNKASTSSGVTGGFSGNFIKFNKDDELRIKVRITGGGDLRAEDTNFLSITEIPTW